MIAGSLGYTLEITGVQEALALSKQLGEQLSKNINNVGSARAFVDEQRRLTGELEKQKAAYDRLASLHRVGAAEAQKRTAQTNADTAAIRQNTAQQQANAAATRATTATINQQIATLRLQNAQLASGNRGFINSFGQVNGVLAGFGVNLGAGTQLLGGFVGAINPAVLAVAALTGGLVALDRAGSGAFKQIELASDILATQGVQNVDGFVQSIKDLRDESNLLASFTSAELVQAATEVVRANRSEADSLVFLRESAAFAISEKKSLAETSLRASTALRQFNIPVEDTREALNLFAAAGNKAKVGAGEFLEGVGDIGDQLAGAGFALEEVLGILVELDNKGLDPAEKGSRALSSVISALSSPTQKGAGYLKDFGIEGATVREKFFDLVATLNTNGEAVTRLGELMENFAERGLIKVTGEALAMAEEIENTNDVLGDLETRLNDNREILEKGLAAEFQELATAFSNLINDPLIVFLNTLTGALVNVKKAADAFNLLDFDSGVVYQDTLGNLRTLIDSREQEIALLEQSIETYGDNANTAKRLAEARAELVTLRNDLQTVISGLPKSEGLNIPSGVGLNDAISVVPEVSVNTVTTFKEYNDLLKEYKERLDSLNVGSAEAEGLKAKIKAIEDLLNPPAPKKQKKSDRSPLEIAREEIAEYRKELDDFVTAKSLGALTDQQEIYEGKLSATEGLIRKLIELYPSLGQAERDVLDRAIANAAAYTTEVEALEALTQAEKDRKSFLDSLDLTPGKLSPQGRPQNEGEYASGRFSTLIPTTEESARRFALENNILTALDKQIQAYASLARIQSSLEQTANADQAKRNSLTEENIKLVQNAAAFNIAYAETFGFMSSSTEDASKAVQTWRDSLEGQSWIRIQEVQASIAEQFRKGKVEAYEFASALAGLNAEAAEAVRRQARYAEGFKNPLFDRGGNVPNLVDLKETREAIEARKRALEELFESQKDAAEEALERLGLDPQNIAQGKIRVELGLDAEGNEVENNIEREARELFESQKEEANDALVRLSLDPANILKTNIKLGFEANAETKELAEIEKLTGDITAGLNLANTALQLDFSSVDAGVDSMSALVTQGFDLFATLSGLATAIPGIGQAVAAGINLIGSLIKLINSAGEAERERFEKFQEIRKGYFEQYELDLGRITVRKSFRFELDENGKKTFDEEATDFALELASGITNAIAEGLRNGPQAFNEAMNAFFDNLVIGMVIKTQVFQKYVQRLQKVIEKGMEDGSLANDMDEINKIRRNMLRELDQVRKDLQGSGFLDNPTTTDSGVKDPNPRPSRPQPLVVGREQDRSGRISFASASPTVQVGVASGLQRVVDSMASLTQIQTQAANTFYKAVQEFRGIVASGSSPSNARSTNLSSLKRVPGGTLP
jgi:hypothetical protein